MPAVAQLPDMEGQEQTLSMLCVHVPVMQLSSVEGQEHALSTQKHRAEAELAPLAQKLEQGIRDVCGQQARDLGDSATLAGARLECRLAGFLMESPKFEFLGKVDCLGSACGRLAALGEAILLTGP